MSDITIKFTKIAWIVCLQLTRIRTTIIENNYLFDNNGKRTQFFRRFWWTGVVFLLATENMLPKKYNNPNLLKYVRDSHKTF